MKRAAIYARFSTDLQNERSVDDQVALCEDYARREGYAVVAKYEDRARSGASVLGRDGLLKLLDDARAGLFDVLIAEALDRLSRDMEDLAGIYKRFSFLGSRSGLYTKAKPILSLSACAVSSGNSTARTTFIRSNEAWLAL
jgi:site-specific DNA recombinase